MKPEFQSILGRDPEDFYQIPKRSKKTIVKGQDISDTNLFPQGNRTTEAEKI